MAKTKERKRYDETFKRKVASEYALGKLTQVALAEKYGTSPLSIAAWIKKYGSVAPSPYTANTPSLDGELELLRRENLFLRKELLAAIKKES